MTENFSLTRYIVVSALCGFLFAILDGLIHANPFAQGLYVFYRPIARASVNAPAGMVIDLVYGFVITGAFLILFNSLPGNSGPVRGASFAVFLWFLRVVMGVAGAWMTLNIPMKVHVYELLAGFGEMLAIGLLLGFAYQGQTAASR